MLQHVPPGGGRMKLHFGDETGRSTLPQAWRGAAVREGVMGQASNLLPKSCRNVQLLDDPRGAIAPKDPARPLEAVFEVLPALRDVRMVWAHLQAAGAHVGFHDPLVPVVPHTRDHADLAGIESLPLTAELLGDQDGIIICTDHDTVDYAFVVENASLVVDTRNATGGERSSSVKIVPA